MGILKFRAWDVVNKQMISQADITVKISELIGYHGNLEIMQFTGAFDYNKKEIYEGDIIKEGCNGLVGVVVWDSELGTYKLDGYGDYYIEAASIEWEVIGNKYENPELLELIG